VRFTIALGLLAASFVSAAGYSYVAIDPPNHLSTTPMAINDSRVVVGTYIEPASGVSQTGGFMWNAATGVFTSIDFPGSNYTSDPGAANTTTAVTGINNSGAMTGWANIPLSETSTVMNLGFIYSGGTYQTFTVPGGYVTAPSAINNLSQVVGYYLSNIILHTRKAQGFLYSGGTFTTIDYPTALTTQLNSINDTGVITGVATLLNSQSQCFTYSGGTYTLIDLSAFPNYYCSAAAINNSGVLALTLNPNSGLGPSIAVVGSNGNFTAVNVTGSTNNIANGLNSAGDVAGTELAGGVSHGFAAFASFNPAALVSLYPAGIAQAGPSFTLIVNGTGFLSGATVKWNGAPLSSTFVNSTQLTATVPATLIASPSTTGALVTVSNPSNGTVTGALDIVVTGQCTTGFANGYACPAIGSLDPESALPGSPTFTLNIAGTGFDTYATVYWNGTPLATSWVAANASSANAQTANQISATVPANLVATAGTALITVIDFGGTLSNAVPFGVGSAGGGGTGGGAGGIGGTGGSGGSGGNGGSGTTGGSGNPNITSLSPNTGAVGGPGFTLTVNGTNFVGGATVQWNGGLLATSFVSSMQLTATVPANDLASSGTANIQVQNLFGSSSNVIGFQVGSGSTGTAGPVITNLSPAQTTAGGAAFTLTVTGTGFASGAVVTWNSTALATTFVSATQVTAAVPASLIATAGTANITEANSGGPNSNAAVFTTTSAGLDFTSALRIADVLDGAGWSTTFIIQNVDSVPVNYAFNFWTDAGTALALPFASGAPGTLSGTLGVGGITYVSTAGISPTLIQGWAEAAASGNIAVAALFRYTAPGVPDSQGSVNATLSGSNIYMPFDNSAGYMTGVAMANTNATQPLSISMIFRTDTGTQSTGQITLPPHSHSAFVLASGFPTTAGVRGSIQFITSTPDLTVLGERFTPSLSFTTLNPF
jgi:hypothetical protein